MATDGIASVGSRTPQPKHPSCDARAPNLSLATPTRVWKTPRSPTRRRQNPSRRTPWTRSPLPSQELVHHIAFDSHSLSCWRAPSTIIQRNITFSSGTAIGRLSRFSGTRGWVYRRVLSGETSTLRCYQQSTTLCAAHLKIRCGLSTVNLDMTDMNGSWQIDSIINHPDNKHFKEGRKRAENAERRKEKSDQRAAEEKRRAEEQRT